MFECHRYAAFRFARDSQPRPHLMYGTMTRTVEFGADQVSMAVAGMRARAHRARSRDTSCFETIHNRKFQEQLPFHLWISYYDLRKIQALIRR